VIYVLFFLILLCDAPLRSGFQGRPALSPAYLSLI
jgi:hypothetical protein